MDEATAFLDGVLNLWTAPSARLATRRRDQPTLLIPVDPAVGLMREHLDAVTR